MASVELLTADAEDLVLGALIAPMWGIYYNGSPIILPASIVTQTVFGAASGFTAIPGFSSVASALGLPLLPTTASMIDFQYAQDWPISNYPQEQGAFQSYDKVTLPYDVRIKLASGGTASARNAFLTTIFAIANGSPGALQLLPPNVSQQPQALFDIMTPDYVYSSCSCTHIDFSRAARNGVTLIVVDMWFQQIAVTSVASFQNTQQPGNAGQFATGNQQPQQLSSQTQSSISASAIY